MNEVECYTCGWEGATSELIEDDDEALYCPECGSGDIGEIEDEPDEEDEDFLYGRDF